METPGTEPTATPESDEALLGRLGELLNRVDPVPDALVGAAEAAFGLRRLDAELAELAYDSLTDEPELAVRSGDGPRLLTFETAALRVELQVEVPVELQVDDGRAVRVRGRLEPAGPGQIEVWDSGGRATRAAEADERGRFVVEEVPPGAVRLLCHRAGIRSVATPWTTLP